MNLMPGAGELMTAQMRPSLDMAAGYRLPALQGYNRLHPI